MMQDWRDIPMETPSVGAGAVPSEVEAVWVAAVWASGAGLPFGLESEVGLARVEQLRLD